MIKILELFRLRSTILSFSNRKIRPLVEWEFGVRLFLLNIYPTKTILALQLLVLSVNYSPTRQDLLFFEQYLVYEAV